MIREADPGFIGRHLDALEGCAWSSSVPELREVSSAVG